MKLHELTSSLKFQIASNTISQLIGKFISAGFTFTATIVAAKALGSQGYGQLTKVITYVSLFYLIVDFGFNPAALLKSKDQSEEVKNQIFSSLFTLRLLLSLVIIFGALGILMFLPSFGSDGYNPLVKLAIFIYLGSVIFAGITTSANAVFQSKMAYHYSAISSSIGSIILFILIYIFSNLFLTTPLFFAAVSAFFVSSLVSSIMSFYFVKKYLKYNFQITIKHAKEIFIAGLPLGLTIAVNALSMRFDSYVLTLTRTTAEVGFYGLAYRIFETIIVIPTFFMNAVFPALVLNIDSSKSQLLFRSRIKTVGIALFFLSIISLILTYIMSPALTYISWQFNQTLAPLRILALGLPGFFLSSLFMWALIAMKQYFTLFKVYFVILIITAVTNILLIPKYGYIAAAWITVISEYLTMFILGIISYKKIRIYN